MAEIVEVIEEDEAEILVPPAQANWAPPLRRTPPAGRRLSRAADVPLTKWCQRLGCVRGAQPHEVSPIRQLPTLVAILRALTLVLAPLLLRLAAVLLVFLPGFPLVLVAFALILPAILVAFT